MKKSILVFLMAIFAFAVNAQNKTTTPRDTKVYNQVDVQPEYPGGLKALAKFVKENTKPSNDKGMAFAMFVVEKDGSISHIKVLRSPSAAASLETVRLISSFPKWKPAIKEGNIVRCNFTMPFRFPDGI